MKRNAIKDMETCKKATKGPWESSDLVGNPVVKSKDAPWFKDVICLATKSDSFDVDGRRKDDQIRKNYKFIAESREALPYWIQRAEEAEKLLQILLYDMKIWDKDEGVPVKFIADMHDARRFLEGKK